MKDIKIDSKKLMEEVKGIMDDSNLDRIRENANKPTKQLIAKRGLVGDTLTEMIGLEMLPERVKQAHIEKDIYFHDLSVSPFYPMFNCMTLNITEMFDNGFKLGETDIKQPKSFKTFMNLLAEVVTAVSSNIYGGLTLGEIDTVAEKYVKMSWCSYFEMAIDWGLSPVKADEVANSLTEKEVYEACQGFEYDLNCLFTSNQQSPFTTVTFGLGTSYEARLIQKGILQQRINGLGKEKKTAVFPKLCYIMDNGINVKPEDPNYDIKQLALECISKRIYPDILSKPRLEETLGYFISPRGCRSFAKKYVDKNGEAVREGRNCLGVISVNLPRLALQAKGDVDKFFELLDDTIGIAHEGLQFRIKRFDNVTADICPLIYQYGALGFRLQPKDKVAEIFKNGYASIALGYIGLEECCKVLTGKSRLEDKRAENLSYTILQVMRGYCDTWSVTEGYAYALYSTPAEALCYKLVDKDRQDFGIIEGVTDKEYYTNSFHVSADTTINPFDRIDFEKGYTGIATGGFISYVELPSLKNNLKALETIVDYQFHNSPYTGVNTPADKCFKCGFEGELTPTDEGYVCPSCGNKDQSTLCGIRRVSGYLSEDTARPVNRGKHAEFKNRKKNL